MILMRKCQISILISLICFLGIIFQNYRLAIMYKNASGKNKALLGITELMQLNVKFLIACALLVGFVFGILNMKIESYQF
ncbi:MAG: hypothetical protein DI598_07025 [Pseudopedobacter saltans]|uniref:Uncharacterized protein n=1 Tax=Pseudopedobacter saltans TaxID=151895 RepID=A0A2W5F4T7_9SPHI|nr:MAG: hypothetical protein DI598_07025 [Pseudopedobacter saltans]